MQEETLIAVAVRRTMFEGSGGKTWGLDEVLGLNTIYSGRRA